MKIPFTKLWSDTIKIYQYKKFYGDLNHTDILTTMYQYTTDIIPILYQYHSDSDIRILIILLPIPLPNIHTDIDREASELKTVTKSEKCQKGGEGSAQKIKKSKIRNLDFLIRGGEAIAKLSLNFNFNFNLVESWYNFILQ